MKLAESSRVKLQEFFRETTGDERLKLPEIHFHAGRFSEVLTRALKIYAITIGGNIFVAPEFVALGETERRKIHLELAAHEITHVVQFGREGFFKFFYRYLKSYLKNLREQKTWDAEARQRAYLDIPFEIEARETAARFVRWNKNNG